MKIVYYLKGERNMTLIIKDLKAFKITTWILIISTIVLMIIYICNGIKYNSYVPVNATIVDSINKRVGSNSNSHKTNLYVKYSFELNGKQYEATRREMSGIVVKGKNKIIFCNPDNPEMLKKDYEHNTLLIVVIIGAILGGAMFVGLMQYKNNNSDYYN